MFSSRAYGALSEPAGERRLARLREQARLHLRLLLLAAGPVAAALMLSLFLSEIVHLHLPVYAQIHLYGAIFISARIGGLRSGLAGFGLALLVSDLLLTEPLYQLFVIDDLPDFIVFGLAAAGAIWIGCLGRKLADDRQQD
jgi:K+-sensing histidine kinase KdpD